MDDNFIHFRNLFILSLRWAFNLLPYFVQIVSTPLGSPNMKGMQKGKYTGQAAGPVGSDLESTGFEVQPVQVLMFTVAFVFCVIMMHFFSKVTA